MCWSMKLFRVNRPFPEARAAADEGLRQHPLNEHPPVDQVGKLA